MAHKRRHAYLLRWRDSASLRGWQNINHPDHGVAIINSIGWLIKDTKREVTITTCISEYGSVNDAITIPREAITKMTRLKHHLDGDE